MKNQINHITKKAYQGYNQTELLQEKSKKGYQSDEWLTFVQAKSLNLKVKKGSKSVSLLAVFDDDQDITKSKSIRYFNVFNLDCTEPWEAK